MLYSAWLLRSSTSHLSCIILMAITESGSLATEGICVNNSCWNCNHIREHFQLKEHFHYTDPSLACSCLLTTALTSVLYFPKPSSISLVNYIVMWGFRLHWKKPQSGPTNSLCGSQNACISRVWVAIRGFVVWLREASHPATSAASI